MRIAPQWMRLGATTLGTGVLAAGATAAWAGADRTHRGRERIAAAGYAPGVLGTVAALTAGPTAAALALATAGVERLGYATPLAVTRALPVLRTTAAFGVAASAGLALGTTAARLGGATPPPLVLRDEDLPAADPARARLEADATYRRLDHDADDLVIWVPGTMRMSTPGDFRAGVRQAMGADTAVVNMPARSDYQIPQGVADTSEALRLLLTRLDSERRPGQRILLAGESQGAWAMGVALADPKLSSIVDRAVVWGNPGVSQHQFDGAGDGHVLELSDEMDVIGRSLEGDAPMVLDGLGDTFDGHWTQAWRLPADFINNPFEAGLLARTGLRLLTPGGYERDPHNYHEFMGSAARFLADAPRPGGDAQR